MDHRTTEHGWSDKNSAIRTHIDTCEGVQYLNNISNMFSERSLTHNEIRASHISIVQSNVKIIDRDDNWNLLLLKEALHIKQLNPILNHGLMASKELSLF